MANEFLIPSTVQGGNPAIGASLTQKSIPSALEQTDSTRGDQVGYIDGGVIAAKAADGSRLAGKIMFPRGVRDPVSFDVTVKGATVSGQTEKVILFSTTAYEASCGETCTSTGGVMGIIGGQTGGAKWYLGTDSLCGVKQVKALQEKLCSTAMNLGALRIQRLDGNQSPVNINQIKVMRGNFIGETETIQNINLASQINPQDDHRDILDVSLTGDSKRLDKDTWYELTVRSNEEYRLTFTVLVYFQYL